MAWNERYVRADASGGGDGTTDTNSGANGAWTLAEAIAAVAAGYRVNVRAGTYANTTTARTFATAGTTTAPIWWRGFNTTPGDLDAVPTSTRTPGTDMPEFTWTTALCTISGAHQIFSNISFKGARTAGTQCALSGGGRFHRCRFENTGANAASSAASLTAQNIAFTACWFKATATATRVVQAAIRTFLAGCVFEGGGIGLDCTGVSANPSVLFCTFNNTGSDGIVIAAAVTTMTVANCSFYSCGSDGIEFTTLPTDTVLIFDNIFSECAAYGINNSTGANTNFIQRVRNLFHSNSSGTENGLGDSPTFNDQTDSSSPFNNAVGGDLSLAAGSNARNNGLPNLFENQSYASYLAIGAVQPQGGGVMGSRIFTGF